MLRSDDSSGWYTSCESDDCLQHCALGLENSDDREDAHKVMVTVPLGILGLSPTLNAGHNMTEEVVRQFTHAVTGEDMFLVYFSTVLGE